MKLIGKLASKSQYLVRMVEDLTLEDIRGRFLNYIKHLSKKAGSETITLPVPKGELSVLLGVSPETFSRLLKKLADDGIIDMEGKKIKILKAMD